MKEIYLEVSNILSFETVLGLTKSNFPNSYLKNMGGDNLHTKFIVYNLTQNEIFELGYILGKYQTALFNF